MNLIGYVDGQEIRFDFHPPAQFTAALPAKKSGTCVVELHAVDDAGNVSAYCDTVVMVDFDRLSVSVIKPGFLSREQSSPFSAREIETGFTYEELI